MMIRVCPWASAAHFPAGQGRLLRATRRREEGNGPSCSLHTKCFCSW